MASVFVKHRVADYEKWKPHFDADDVNRRAAGITSYSLHRSAEDPNTIIIAMRVENLQKAAEFFGGPELQEAMEKAGVQGEPEVWMTEDIAEG